MSKSSCKAVFVYGTSAELIKIWPVIEALKETMSLQLLSANQQPHELRILEDRLDIGPVTHLRDPNKPNLTNKLEVPLWAIRVLLSSLFHILRTRVKGQKAFVLVHGDTMTSVIGAVAGKVSFSKVVHIEAGLRSHDWRNPFPEEINRIITARLAHYHFAPTQEALKNLSNRRGIKIDTHGNTSIDSMRKMSEKLSTTNVHQTYCLVSLHRAELLANVTVLRETISELITVSRKHRLVMVIDALTRETLLALDLQNELLSSSIKIFEKMPYPDFLQLVIESHCIVTDSGGLQEEAGFLSKRCLVHRRATERDDGIGTTSKLSMWESGAISQFIEVAMNEPSEISTVPKVDGFSPTAIIAERLTQDCCK